MSAGEKAILFLALACFFFLPLGVLLSRSETEREDEGREIGPRRHPSTADGRERIADRRERLARPGSSTIPPMRMSTEDGGRK